MTALDFTGRITNGRLPPSEGKRLLAALSDLEGKMVKLALSEVKRIRTNPQNSFYHGPFIEAIRLNLLACGYRISPDDIHAGLRDAYAKNAYTIPLPGGLEFRVPPSTARLKTFEFSDFLEEIRADYASRVGWQLPFPNQPQGD